MNIIEAREYIARPIVVEAVQWNGSRENYDYIVAWSNHSAYRETRNVLKVDTYGQTVEARANDWVIKTGDMFMVMDDDTFLSRYQLTDSELERNGDMHAEA